MRHQGRQRPDVRLAAYSLSMAPAGSLSAPTHVIAHLSDTHLIAGGGLLHGHIDTASQLHKALARVEQSAQHFDALVLSGDLTDQGRAGGLPAPPRDRRAGRRTARRRPCVMTGGNHDERRALALGLNGADTDEPQDAVTMVRGLRIISLDSALPGYHHGGFSDTQYDWLSTQLAQPAEHGTILVMHHAADQLPLTDDAAARLRGRATGCAQPSRAPTFAPSSVATST